MFACKKTKSSASTDIATLIDGAFAKLEGLVKTIGEVLKPIGYHLKTVGTLSALATAIASFVILKTYSTAIGRPDLMAKVIDKTFTGLLPWIVLIIMFFILYAFVMLTTTMLYALAVSFFKETTATFSRVAVLLVIPVLVGSLLFVGFIFQGPEINKSLIAACVIGGTLITTLSTLIDKKMRYAFRYVALYNNILGLGKKRYQFLLFLFVFWLILAAVASAVYPAALLLESYAGEDTPEGVKLLMGITMLAVTMLFVPALTFFISKENIVRRSLRAIGFAFGTVFAVILVCPGAGSAIVYIAASPIGVRDSTADHYRLLKNYKIGDFGTAWGKVSGVPDLPVVNAFPLFALGDVLLLCPSSLASTKLRDWKSDLSRSCILTQSADVVKLPEGSSTADNPSRTLPAKPRQGLVDTVTT